MRSRSVVPAALLALGSIACSSTEPSATRAEPSEPVAAASRAAIATAAPSPSPSPATEAEPERARFAGRIRELPAALAAEMRGTTWKPRCPVPLSDLRLLRFNYWNFQGEVRRGPMVVNAAVAEDVLWVFGRLFQARFPLKRVALAKEFKPERFLEHRRVTSHKSVTAAFNCRPVVTPLGPSDSLSQHSYGLAIDVNPLQNPYVTASGFVRNRVAEHYLDRSLRLEGMIHPGDVVVRSFAAIGWEWGGRWIGDQDYMHFSYLGR